MTITSALAIAPTTTGAPPTIPRYSTNSKPHPDRLALLPAPCTTMALQAILREVAPGEHPYSTDSFLPAHLVQAAQAALELHDSEASQHAYNALSTAAWHCARGEPAKALSRMRRAQSHIMASMEGGAA